MPKRAPIGALSRACLANHWRFCRRSRSTRSVFWLLRHAPRRTTHSLTIVPKSGCPARAAQYAKPANPINSPIESVVGVDHHADRFVVIGVPDAMFVTNR